jgi:hypothetical protein
LVRKGKSIWSLSYISAQGSVGADGRPRPRRGRADPRRDLADRFWFLVGLGLLMVITAIVFVPESLPAERRHGGGLRQFISGLSEVLGIRLFVGYVLTAALSGFTMMAYIANSSYMLQVQNGLEAPTVRALLRLHRPGPGAAVDRVWAVAAPLASSGGDATAVPMIWVMIAGVAGSLFT